MAVSLHWSLVSSQRAQLRLTTVLHGGGEHWPRRVDHSSLQEDLREDAEEELQSREVSSLNSFLTSPSS